MASARTCRVSAGCMDRSPSTRASGCRLERCAIQRMWQGLIRATHSPRTIPLRIGVQLLSLFRGSLRLLALFTPSTRSRFFPTITISRLSDGSDSPANWTCDQRFEHRPNREAIRDSRQRGKDLCRWRANNALDVVLLVNSGLQIDWINSEEQLRNTFGFSAADKTPRTSLQEMHKERKSARATAAVHAHAHARES